MASFKSWESDPLFSAAEVVQDSADRMESIFRMLLHDRSLLEGDPSDSKLLASIDYHERDLVTALGTTKWQLEDFERAIHLSSLSARSQLREEAVLRHKQFIRAISEQIAVVERHLGSPSRGNMDKNAHWAGLNDQDKDGFALFLSGSTYKDTQVQYDSDNSIMKRFLDSASPSGFNEKSAEIVEMRMEESEQPTLNGATHKDNHLDSIKDTKSRRVGSQYLSRLGQSSDRLEKPPREKECEFSRSGLLSRVDLLVYVRNLWLTSRRKIMTRSSTKKRKDGEVTDDHVLEIERLPLSSAVDLSQIEQGNHAWMSLTSRYFGRLAYSRRFFGWPGALQRTFPLFQLATYNSRFPVLITSWVVCTVIFVGLLVFRVT
ncbi:hypothetical protein H6P81_003614 [Aristolochia fimbriata]|uniref:Syntaxin 6/10/61 N-terminal domain-containing protein n=1 Tax=Aristolochia fimbriata TaxID=158543 RepID=A0AAV7FGS2_ARIFI|nr:hypothetical protein H6P81_003614 [Aristolochia fimbriata]